MGIFGELMAFFMLFSGALLTVRLRFFQFSHLLRSLRAPFSGKKKANGISGFQAMATALGGSVGTANIAGVAGAIVIGGPGAVFWMWVAALLGMATKCAEILLAVKYRGGAMVCIERGMGQKYRPLAVAFAVFGLLSSLFGTALVQSNTVALSVYGVFSGLGISFEKTPVLLAAGLLTAIFAGSVIFGGAKRIGGFSEKAVPVMAIIYILSSLVIIIINRNRAFFVFKEIFRSALSVRSLGGSSVFLAFRTGVARGVYSNEAGVGSAPMAHALSSEVDPVIEGMSGIFEVFFDTVVVCTMTALVLLSSGIPIPYGASNVSGTALVSSAFEPLFGSFSPVFISLLIIVFAFTSIVGWSLYGESCAKYLFGDKIALPYRIVFTLLLPAFALVSVDKAWFIGELLNYLMALPNLVMLLSLSGIAQKEVAAYKMFEKKPGKRYNRV